MPSLEVPKVNKLSYQTVDKKETVLARLRLVVTESVG